MKKIVLIDGNNLIFRAFYAIRDNGGNLRTSFGLTTNALYGFVNMINKIIAEEKPEYIAVAFDKGKNFRKAEYDFYKEGRKETPIELKEQFPYAKEILNLMGITYLELEPYEADDIIGTLAKMVKESEDFSSVIISSDVDLTQLIDEKNEMKLLKQKSSIRYTKEAFENEYLFEPKKIIDLKSLMGDSSDNIPGVKGVGEKTALKLIQTYGSLDGVYENTDLIKGAVKDKLISDKKNAYISFKLATIFCDVPLNLSLDDLIYKKESDELYEMYEKLEFKTFLKNKPVKINNNFIKVTDVNNITLNDDLALYAEYSESNYHAGSLVGFSIYDGVFNYYFSSELLEDVKPLLIGKTISTYNAKKCMKTFGPIFTHDLMISEFLLSKNVKDDITSLMPYLEKMYSYNDLKKHNFENIVDATCLKSEFIFNEIKNSINELHKEELLKLYENLEMKLYPVLYEMEENGVMCDSEILTEIGDKITAQINVLTKEIHDLAGEEFNIQSPKQLGEIIYEKMQIGKGKKNKTGYVTDASALEKLKSKHEIIEKILLYRNLEKINSTYVNGILKHINENKMVHPIFNQTLARTGRLSCSEPNLQNIPVREELGKQIRKAFSPVNDVYLSFDYSQIELRILAHISGDEKLISSFINDKDIHRSVAADIYGKSEEDVTKVERKTAKAVIFGIVYGISGFGLGENLKITRKEADEFINKYYEIYPSVKKYMDEIIAKTKISGSVRTLYNRKRVITEINSSMYMVKQMGERMALNTPIQGTSADIIKAAMIKINKEFKVHNLKSKMVLQVHDELIFDVVNEEKEKVISIVKINMENIIRLSVPLKVEMSEGLTWFEV